MPATSPPRHAHAASSSAGISGMAPRAAATWAEERTHLHSLPLQVNVELTGVCNIDPRWRDLR